MSKADKNYTLALSSNLTALEANLTSQFIEFEKLRTVFIKGYASQTMSLFPFFMILFYSLLILEKVDHVIFKFLASVRRAGHELH